MPNPGLDTLQATIPMLQASRWIGRISEIRGGVVVAKGLSHVAALGDQVQIIPKGGSRMRAEVLSLEHGCLTIFPDGELEGVRVDDKVELIGPSQISPDESWLGRIVDPYGNPLDGAPIMTGPRPRPLRGPAINPAQRRACGQRFETGLKVFNTLLPIVRGQRIGLFSGSGVGKSTLLGKLALGLQADIVVIAMIGERGRELREFVERILGRAGMARSVIVTATSDQSALARRQCAWAAMAVAEHFRDCGKQVLFLADSVTRLAEAHREVALSTGETGSLRGFPPSTAHLISHLCERAGPGAGSSGDITAVFTVLVAGSDMDEPVADMLRGVLDGHVVLDRKIAERGRFPAIDLLRSVSRALPHAASDQENEMIRQARALLGTYEKNELMIQAGLYAAGTDAGTDTAIEAWPRLDRFISESEPDTIEASFRALSNCLGHALEQPDSEENITP